MQQLQLQREQELRLQQQQQQQQQEEELRLKIPQREDELRLWQHERAPENKLKKAQANEDARRLKLEPTNGSSRASGSMADEIERVETRRNHKRTAGWEESVAQQSVSRRPPSRIWIDPPTIVTQEKVDNYFSTYPKISPFFQPGEGLSWTQLTEPSILKN